MNCIGIAQLKCKAPSRLMENFVSVGCYEVWCRQLVPGYHIIYGFTKVFAISMMQCDNDCCVNEMCITKLFAPLCGVTDRLCIFDGEFPVPAMQTILTICQIETIKRSSRHKPNHIKPVLHTFVPPLCIRASTHAHECCC